MAAQLCGTTVDMSEVHRFTNGQYATLTLRMREGTNPEDIFDQLHALGLVRLHTDEEALQDHIAGHTSPEDTVTVWMNAEATALNEHIRAHRRNTDRIPRSGSAFDDQEPIRRGDRGCGFYPPGIEAMCGSKGSEAGTGVLRLFGLVGAVVWGVGGEEVTELSFGVDYVRAG